MTDPARALATAMAALNRARRDQVRLLRGTVVTWNATDGYIVNVSGTELATVPGTAALVSDGALVPGDVVSLLDYKSSPHVLGKIGASGGPAAISAAQVGFTASDIGGVEVAFGPAPVSPSAGELWYDSANGYRLNQWSGTAWQPYQFTSAALDAAAGITAGQVAFSASEIGGVTVTIAGTAPSSPATGDLWYDSGNGYVLKQWSGSAWTAYQWGAGALAAGSVGSAQIAGGAVGSGQVSFTARDIGGITTTVAGTAPSSPLTDDLWFDSGNGYKLNQWNGSAWQPHQYGTGALAAGSVTAAVIAAGTITATQIQAGTITASQIAANTITAANIAANAITSGQIAAGTITATQIAAGTITGALIAAGTVTASNIQAGTITAANIASGTITAANIAASTITAAQVAAGTITATQIAAATITAGQLAAGIVYAGIVDATTIQGASLVATGASGEFLAYSGTPSPPNFLTGQTATFDGGIGTWVPAVAGNCTLGAITSPVRDGTGAMAATATAAGAMTFQSCVAANILTQGLPCSPGDQIYCSSWLEAATTGRSAQAGAAFYTSGGVLVSTLLAVADADVTSGYQQVSGTVTAPATAAFCCAAVSVLAAGAGEVHDVDDAFLANVTVTPPNLITSISATPGADASGNTWPGGLQVGAAGGSQVLLDPLVNQRVNVTTLIAGILEAAVALTTDDAGQAVAGLFGAMLLGTGTATKMTTLLSSPVGAGAGAALMLEAENDGGTDTPVITLGTVTSPDGLSEVFSPILTLSQFALLMYGGTSGQVVQTLTTSQTWTAPAGVTSVKVECWGGGGGGGYGGTTGGGGGGSGGGYAVNPAVTVTPTTGYAVVVGAGGAGNSTGSGNGAAGSASTFNSSTVVSSAGFGGISNFGVGGGASTGGTGTTLHQSGAGGSGAFHTVNGGGGGGGGSAGSSGNGNAGQTPTGQAGGNGASAVSGGGGGGNGGVGRLGVGGDGSNGSVPGGGGGGGGYIASGFKSGGNGIRGQVRLTYLPAGTAPTILASVASASGTDQFGNTYPASVQLPSQSGSIDGWHAVTLPTNWTGTARVRLLAVPPNSAEFDFAIVVPASSPGTSFGTFPSSAYYPLTLRPVYPAITGSTAPTSNFRVNINTASTGPTIGGTIPASTTTVSGTVIYPLD